VVDKFYNPLAQRSDVTFAAEKYYSLHK